MGLIEKMIENTKKTKLTDKQKQEQELKQRRDRVLQRIGASAMEYLDVENNIRDEEILEQRLRDANEVRISQAEALAALSETGDFETPIQWWEILDGEQSLWKGYVFRQAHQVGTSELGITMTIVARRIAEGGFVAELIGIGEQGGDGVTVGLSEESMQGAVNEAFFGFCRVKNIGQPYIPGTLILRDGC